MPKLTSAAPPPKMTLIVGKDEDEYVGVRLALPGKPGG
jgi:hypothetical protein